MATATVTRSFALDAARAPFVRNGAPKPVAYGLGRSLYERKRLPVRLLILVSMGVLATTELWRYVTATQVKGGYFEVIRDTSMAPGAFIVICYLTDLSSKWVRRLARRLLSPIAVLGAMALSVYVLRVAAHLLALRRSVAAMVGHRPPGTPNKVGPAASQSP